MFLGNNAALWHRGIRYIRLWVDNTCIRGFVVDNRKNIEHHQSLSVKSERGKAKVDVKVAVKSLMLRASAAQKQYQERIYKNEIITLVSIQVLFKWFPT